MTAPTRGDAKAATSRPRDKPPTIQASGQPVSRAIGSASTAGM
jgi:hypothetical protein